MNELKFNSQVCTSIEQSQHLLELGLNPETADMFYVFDYTIWHINGIQELVHPNQLEETDVPAWSLHRLFEMICNKECEEHYYFDFSIDYDSMADVYNSIIEVIERHIKENRFNKKYLKQ